MIEKLGGGKRGFHFLLHMGGRFLYLLGDGLFRLFHGELRNLKIFCQEGQTRIPCLRGGPSLPALSLPCWAVWAITFTNPAISRFRLNRPQSLYSCGFQSICPGAKLAAHTGFEPVYRP
jgi:hypothetical protein